MKSPLPLLSVLLFTGCLYTNIRVPRAYRSASPSDVKAAESDARVSGRACNRTVLFLVAWGDAGYAAAVSDALKGRPSAVLYDVQADVQARSYLIGLYNKVCTVVTGRIGAP